MSIFKLKFKAHRFVNFIFYIIVFFIGFYLGFIGRTMNIKEFLTRFLFIDNVYALEQNTYNYNGTYIAPTVGSNGSYKNEEYIYNLFNFFSTELSLNISFNDYHYVISTYSQNSSSLLVTWYFSTDPITLTQNGWNAVNLVIITYNPYNQSPYIWRIYTHPTANTVGGSFGSNTHSNQQGVGTNDLDFSNYTDLVFNPNLFSDDSNFKEVCVLEGQTFAITPSEGNYSNNGQYEDFFWFPYGLNSGLFYIQYDSSSQYSEGNIVPYSSETMSEHFYFSSREQINSFYDTDLPSDLENAGYVNKYSYYGYDAYKFFIVYRQDLYNFPIFVFDHPSKTYVGLSGTIHGGGGRIHLDTDEEVVISNDYCFYIKTGYEVNLVNVNEYGDFNGTVSSPDGNYDFFTFSNEYNSNSGTFLSQPITFINSMKDTISFINSLIYQFYISLPVLLRTFIVTVLILFLIMLIMSIGGY